MSNSYGSLSENSSLYVHGSEKKEDVYLEFDPSSLSYDRTFPDVSEINTIRDIQRAVYEKSRHGCYNLLSILIGVIISWFWGMVMGILQFLYIWFVRPPMMIIKLIFQPWAKIVGMLLSGIFGDCYARLRFYPDLHIYANQTPTTTTTTATGITGTSSLSNDYNNNNNNNNYNYNNGIGENNQMIQSNGKSMFKNI